MSIQEWFRRIVGLPTISEPPPFREAVTAPARMEDGYMLVAGRMGGSFMVAPVRQESEDTRLDQVGRGQHAVIRRQGETIDYAARDGNGPHIQIPRRLP